MKPFRSFIWTFTLDIWTCYLTFVSQVVILNPNIIGNVIVLVIMQTVILFDVCWFLNIKLEVIYVSVLFEHLQHILTTPW